MAIQDCKGYVFKLLVYGTLFCQLTITDATITWTLPPPQRGPLQTSDSSTRTTIQKVINGSSEACLTWNFTFSGEILDRVTFEKGNTRIGKKTSSGTVSIDPTDNFQEHFDISRGDPATLIIYNVTEADEAVFACQVETNIKTWTDQIEVQIVVETRLTSYSDDQTVSEGSNVTLFCNATGKPTPNVTWTRVLKNGTDGDVMFFGNPWVIVNISRTATGTYRCTAYNGIGNPVNHSLYINVTYPPEDTRVNHTIEVSERDSASIYCPVLGNPHPNITWYKGNDTSSGIVINTTNPLKFPETVFNDSGWYTCFAENYLGNVTVTVQLRVVVENPSTPITSSEPMTKDPGVRDSEVNATAKIRNVRYKKELANMSSDDSRNLTSRFKRGVSEVYQKADDYKDIYSDTRVNKFENGSVVVFFTIIFNEVVHIDDAILVLKNASGNGTLGDLKIEPGSIEALLPVATTPATTSPKETATTTPTSGEGKDNDLWIIIGASVGGVIVLAIVVAVVAWCVHHKRKCRRKGSKVRCSESEAFAPGEDNGSGHVNNGYADAGPRPTAMEDMSQHQGASAVPTYAVVDKSAKKGSKKDKVEEQKPQAEAPEATYAQVDKSKKSKKKPKPGEVLYADLGDFQQMQELPRVSTSPQALPPIKKPTTYVETQYADITQFLKGDVTLPDSNNSQGPAIGSKAAPAPENSNSQEPGTNTKETSRASNAGGDGGPGHETNF